MTSDDAVVEGQRRLWSAGNYPAVAERLEVASTALLDAVVPAVHAAVAESNVAADGVRLPAPYLVLTGRRPR